MSFARAPRFNEKNSSGPAPGYYNVQDIEKPAGTIIFEHSLERFKSNNEVFQSTPTADSHRFVAPKKAPSCSSKRKLTWSNIKSKPHANNSSSSLQQRADATNAEVERLVHVVNNLQDERDTLQEKVVEVTSKISKLQVECDEIIQEKSDLNILFEKCRAELSDSKETEKLLHCQLQNIQIDYDTSISRQQHEFNSLQSEYQQLISDIKIIEEKKTHLINELDESNVEIDNLKSLNKRVQEELMEVKKKLDTKEMEKVGLENDLKEIQQELIVICQDRDKYKERLEETSKELKQNEDELTESRKKFDVIKGLRADSETALESMTLKFEEEKAASDKLRQIIKDMEERHEATVTEFTRRIFETQKKLNLRENEIKLTDEEHEHEMKKLKLEKQALEVDLSEISNELQKIKLDETEDQKLVKEVEKWKLLYEDLEEKVKPFQTQLDAYSAEKAMLLDETSAAQAEANKLGRKYAELLGHQNNKQKIKHIVKLKEQNIELRDENHKLRHQVSTLQKQALQNRKPKFDPSKAFQHHKENRPVS